MTPERLLRTVAGGGLLLCTALIVYQRSVLLAVLLCIALLLCAYIEYGGGDQWIRSRISPGANVYTEL